MPQPVHRSAIQSVINRMARNSFLLKAWCVTLVSGILALGAKEGRFEFGLAALIPIVAFGCLDAYYLMLERRFRDLYGAAAQDKTDAYSMDVSEYRKGRTLVGALASPSVWGLYVPLLATAAAVLIIGARAGTP